MEEPSNRIDMMIAAVASSLRVLRMRHFGSAWLSSGDPLTSGITATPVSKPVPAKAEPARAGPARSPAWGDEFPLPPARWPAPAALIQRQPVAPPVDLTVAAQGTDVVQRAVETPPETGLATTEEEGPELDLDHLARQIYPLIKRMLAVERERRSAR